MAMRHADPAETTSTKARFGLPALAAAALLWSGCNDVPRGAADKNDLSKMKTVSLAIGTKATYTAYVADTADTVRVGLMNTTEAELPTDRGMIFVFDEDQLLSFWMRNTIIPLDIAYIRSDGTIVKTYTMKALDETGYPSIQAARFALELRAGQISQRGIKVGDIVQIPASLLDGGS